MIASLKALDLKPGDSIGLKRLCEFAALSVAVWADRLRWSSSMTLVNLDLRPAGFEVRYVPRGKRPAWVFVKLG